MSRAGADRRIESAFQIASFTAAALCLLAAWTASRVPTLRFDRDETASAPSVE